MSRINRHGIWGRERQAFHQSRAADMCTQKMIEEYVRPRPGRIRSQRPVPIRHKGEFVQSTQSSLEVQMAVDDMQLDLPYVTTKSKSRDHVGIKNNSKHSRADQSIDGVLLLKPSGSPHRKRFESATYNATTKAQKAMKPERYTEATRDSHITNSALTWPGFLYGCVIGGAAAAVALVLLDATVL